MLTAPISYHGDRYVIEFHEARTNGHKAIVIDKITVDGEEMEAKSVLGDKLCRREFRGRYKSPLAKYRKHW